MENQSFLAKKITEKHCWKKEKKDYNWIKSKRT